MFNVPILFIIFKRLDTTKQVFSQIRRIQPRHLFIAADGPRDTVDGEAKKCEIVREWVMNNIDWNCDVKTNFREKNLGCKYGFADAHKWFFSFVNAGIVLEDDCYPDISFFPYCEELLEKYKDNPKISHITGRNNITKYKPKKQSYYFTTGASVLGFATWKREVNRYDPDIVFPPEDELAKSLLSFTKDPKESRLFAKWAQETSSPHFNSWDVQWGVAAKLREQYGITPAINMIEHIGWTGEDGTHSSAKMNDFAKVQTMKFPLVHPSVIEPNYELSKKIAHFIMMPPSIGAKMKHWCKTIVKAILPYGLVRLIQKRNTKK